MVSSELSLEKIFSSHTALICPGSCRIIVISTTSITNISQKGPGAIQVFIVNHWLTGPSDWRVLQSQSQQSFRTGRVNSFILAISAVRSELELNMDDRDDLPSISPLHIQICGCLVPCVSSAVCIVLILIFHQNSTQSKVRLHGVENWEAERLNNLENWNSQTCVKSRVECPSDILYLICEIDGVHCGN